MIDARRILALCLLLVPMLSQATALDDLLQQYAAEAQRPFSAEAGKRMWTQTHPSPKGGPDRSCSLCHGEDLTRVGKHARTGKKIDPLAPSVNPERLTKAKHMRKWLKRNCKWVLGRECTAQEKGDFLSYIRSQ